VDVPDVALLQSNLPYIAVPDALYVDIWSVFKEYDWDCTVNSTTPENDFCSSNMRCANYIQEFPTFTLTFTQYTSMGIKEYFNVTMPPEMYLQETDDNTRCLSHFRPINKDSVGGFKLGSAFFRNVSVEF